MEDYRKRVCITDVMCDGLVGNYLQQPYTLKELSE
jgi:hypothetical protein